VSKTITTERASSIIPVPIVSGDVTSTDASEAVDFSILAEIARVVSFSAINKTTSNWYRSLTLSS